jgi:pimeloyl-ACP methyl ester carboxylesterase
MIPHKKNATLTEVNTTELQIRIDLPTLVIHGTADTLIDISGGRRTADVVPGARLVEVEGMGHDYPEAFWPTLVGETTAHALRS